MAEFVDYRPQPGFANAGPFTVTEAPKPPRLSRHLPQVMLFQEELAQGSEAVDGLQGGNPVLNPGGLS